MNKTESIIEVLDQIGKEAFEMLKETDNEVEKAFLLGMVNVCGSFCAADEVDDTTNCVTISLDYKEVKKDFENAIRNANTPKEKVEQPTLEDFFPELFKKLDEMHTELRTEINQKIDKLMKKQKKE